MHDRPHVSPALLHVRGWVTLCALVVSLCAVGQMVVFAIAHYTDVRFVSTEPSRPASSLKVVGAVQRGEEPAPAPTSATPGRPTATAKPTPVVDAANDGALRGVASVITSTGILASLVLTWIAGLGTLVAAGAAVPGVDKAVRAAACAVILTIIALPLGQILGSDVLPGIFSTYSALSAASDLVRAGGASEAVLIGQFIALPMLAIAMATGVGLWFRAGVEAGIIATSPADLDDRIEAELGRVRTAGVTAGSGTVRAVGALNKAIGSGSPVPSITPAEAPGRAAGGDDDQAIERLLGKKPRRMNEPDAGSPLKRLI